MVENNKKIRFESEIFSVAEFSFVQIEIKRNEKPKAIPSYEKAAICCKKIGSKATSKNISLLEGIIFIERDNSVATTNNCNSLAKNIQGTVPNDKNLPIVSPRVCGKYAILLAALVLP